MLSSNLNLNPHGKCSQAILTVFVSEMHTATKQNYSLIS